MTEHSAESVEVLFGELGRSTDAEALADLLGGFNDGLPSLETGELGAFPRLIAGKLVDHADPRVRVEAVTAAATIGDEATLPRIRRVLHDR